METLVKKNLRIVLAVVFFGLIGGCQDETPQPRSKGDDVLLKFNSGNGQAASKYSSKKDEQK